MPRHHHRRGDKKKGPEVPVPPERAERTALFGRTKMCKFHILGCCSRGSECNFAHDPTEMNPLPDLTRTKLCKTLINTGQCDNPECKYAHNKDELRGTPPPLPKSSSNNAREGQGAAEAAQHVLLNQQQVPERSSLPEQGPTIPGLASIDQAMPPVMPMVQGLQAMQMNQMTQMLQAGMLPWGMDRVAAHAQAIAAQMHDADFTPASMLGSRDSPQVTPWSTPVGASSYTTLDGSSSGKARDAYRPFPGRGSRGKGGESGALQASPGSKGEKGRAQQKLMVKNTFITCEDEVTPRPLRVVHSAAGRLNMLGHSDVASEDGEESLEHHQVRRTPDDHPSNGLPLYAPVPDPVNMPQTRNMPIDGSGRIGAAGLIDRQHGDPDRHEGGGLPSMKTGLLNISPDSELSQPTAGLVRNTTWGGTSLATLTEETAPKNGDIDEDDWDMRQVSGSSTASDGARGAEPPEKRVQDTPLQSVAEVGSVSRRSCSSTDSPRSHGPASSDDDTRIDDKSTIKAVTEDEGQQGRGQMPELNAFKAQGLSVKNTFLEWERPPAPLRSIQTAAGRLDRLVSESLEETG